MRRGFLVCLVMTLAGLCSQLGARAAISLEQTNAILPKIEVIAGDVAYCRVGNVTDDLAGKMRLAYRSLAETTTNKIKGLVLDLRFAGGNDYAAAAATADLFLAKERPLLNWGDGIVKSKSKTDAIAGPLTTLINGETSGAAEALAATLRQADGSLLIGNVTAGLTNVAPVTLGDGSELAQVQPDIPVSVSLADERERFANPYMVALKADSTNSIAVTNRAWVALEKLSEADLVRAKRNGTDLNNLDQAGIVPVRTLEAEPPTIRDPALARAVDLIKGLAALQMHF